MDGSVETRTSSFSDRCCVAGSGRWSATDPETVRVRGNFVARFRDASKGLEIFRFREVAGGVLAVAGGVGLSWSSSSEVADSGSAVCRIAHDGSSMGPVLGSGDRRLS